MTKDRDFEREIDFEEVWRVAVDYFRLGEHSIHGPDHWKRVERHGCNLAVETGADLTVVRLFAAFHDAAREDDGEDPEHGFRAGELILYHHGELFKLPTDRLETLLYACRYHNDGMTSDDATIGTCWDADRLDLTRICITPQAEFMSTPAGKTAAAQTRGLMRW